MGELTLEIKEREECEEEAKNRLTYEREELIK